MKHSVVVMCAYCRVTWLVPWFRIGRARSQLMVHVFMSHVVILFFRIIRQPKGERITVGSFQAMGSATGYIPGRWIDGESGIVRIVMHIGSLCVFTLPVLSRPPHRPTAPIPSPHPPLSLPSPSSPLLFPHHQFRPHPFPGRQNTQYASRTRAQEHNMGLCVRGLDVLQGTGASFPDISVDFAYKSD